MNNLFLLLPTLAWIASVIGTYIVLRILTRACVMDNPNERSNHKAPVPRGGGLAMIGVALICLFFAGIAWQILAAALLLAAVSFADDLRGMPVWLRFGTQFIAVALAMDALNLRIFPLDTPQELEWAFVALLWLWFINLTNFMDGIDGISAMQAIMQAVGIMLFHMFTSPLPMWLAISAGIMAAVSLGFLRYNLSPARIFMGDVGSIPLGFLMGFLLLTLASYGHWAAALLLPAYYLTDATLTLFKRALRGEKVWRAHSEHAYQKAVRRGLSHNAVVARITLLNLLLIGLALLPMHSIMAGIITCVAGYAAALLMVVNLANAPAKEG